MRKFILLPSFYLIISLLVAGCYSKPKQTTSAMIILNNVYNNDITHDCKECYKEIYKTIENSTRGIIDIDITLSQDQSTVLIFIEYNHKIGSLDKIKSNLISLGYQVDLN